MCQNHSMNREGLSYFLDQKDPRHFRAWFSNGGVFAWPYSLSENNESPEAAGGCPLRGVGMGLCALELRYDCPELAFTALTVFAGLAYHSPEVSFLPKR